MGADDEEAPAPKTRKEPPRSQAWKPPDQKIHPVMGMSNLRSPRAGYPKYRHAVGGHMGLSRADSIAGESVASSLYSSKDKSKRGYGTGIPAAASGRSGKLSPRSSGSSASGLLGHRDSRGPKENVTVGGINRSTKGPPQDTGRWERYPAAQDKYQGPMVGTTVQLPPRNQIKTTSLNLALDSPSPSEAGNIRHSKSETSYRIFAALPMSPRREADPAAPGPGFIRTRLGGFYAREKFIQP